MINTLFDKREMKKFDDLAAKQAKLDGQKRKLVKKFMENTDSETMENVFEVVKEYGHPNEKMLSEEMENRYMSGEELDFDDLIKLDSLYKSNFEKFSKKG